VDRGRGAPPAPLFGGGVDAADGVPARLQRDQRLVRKHATPENQEPASRPGAGKQRYQALIGVRREAVLHARDEGRYSAATLAATLNALDADRINIELKGPPTGAAH
jgi:hypothetical protein